jgi:hypothetical protein
VLDEKLGREAALRGPILQLDDSHAREAALSSAPGARHILRAMAGQPLRRPRLGKPSQAPLARAVLSTAAWRGLSLTEQVETLFGCSLNRAFEVPSWPADGLDPVRLAAQIT